MKNVLWDTMTFPGKTLKQKRVAQLRAVQKICTSMDIFRNASKMIEALQNSGKEINYLTDMDAIEREALTA